MLCDIHHCPFSVPLLKDNHGWILDCHGNLQRDMKPIIVPKKPGYFLVVLEVALEGRPLRFPWYERIPLIYVLKMRHNTGVSTFLVRNLDKETVWKSLESIQPPGKNPIMRCICCNQRNPDPSERVSCVQRFWGKLMEIVYWYNGLKQ